MKKDKNRIIDNIEVLDFAAEGKCIVKHEGEVIFIEGSNVCPGDQVKIVVNKSKKRFSEGRILQFNALSPDRITPFCSHFGVCGGCKWQHIPYQTQLTQKFQQVKDQLSRIGKIDVSEIQPILGSKMTQFYRNKLEFTFSNSRWLTDEEVNSGNEFNKNALGFHIPKRFEKVLPITKCYLQDDPSNDIRNFFSDYAHTNNLSFYDHVAHEGFFRNLIIRTSSIGQTMVVVQFATENIKNIKKVLDDFIGEFPNITSLNYIINKKRNDSYFDLEPVNFNGLPYIEEEMEGLRFRIGVKSFYQTNSDQAYELYKIVREFAEIKENDLVYDLYTGTGTIANFVAKKAKKVIGIEYIEAAIEDAKENSKINNIKNTVFYAGDMAKVLNEDFLNKNGTPDVIIVDPPRAGMDKSVCEVLLKTNARKLVYVSCNAATQARDLEILIGKYEVDKIKPVDMFPHTFHVENVVSLNLKQ
jgi:23S rRNA (uracil1939-C5)-methyltransferase